MKLHPILWNKAAVHLASDSNTLINDELGMHLATLTPDRLRSVISDQPRSASGNCFHVNHLNGVTHQDVPASS